MTIKTFDANRVGGGTFQLEQDPLTGEYKVKEVGFVKLPDLKLPEIEQAAPVVPDPTPDDPTDDDPDPDSATGADRYGGGERVDFTGESMYKNIQKQAHARIDDVEKDVIEIKTEMKIQFKDLYNRIKRMEAIMIGISGASLLLLLRMTFMS